MSRAAYRASSSPLVGPIARIRRPMRGARRSGAITDTTNAARTRSRQRNAIRAPPAGRDAGRLLGRLTANLRTHHVAADSGGLRLFRHFVLLTYQSRGWLIPSRSD